MFSGELATSTCAISPSASSWRRHGCSPRGGRPVIYQSEAEYDNLPDDIRYRHVRYEPDAATPIDFTWEREWRIHADELPLEARHCRVAVANSSYARTLRARHDIAQSDKVYDLTLVLGEATAEQMAKAFPWRLVDLDDLRADSHKARGVFDQS